MKIAVFTSNQPRHLALVRALSAVADEVIAVQESTTVFPGDVADFFDNSATMQAYFSRVMAAEHAVFGDIGFLPANVRQLSIKMGDVSRLGTGVLALALAADVVVVFGASYIKGELVESLIERRAVNLHMGLSPYYRGSSCNFWALHDRNPDLVGATIHLLSKGLDSGDILFQARPRAEAVEPFEFGMRAVKAALDGLVHHLGADTLFAEPVAQDRALEIRYTRHADFDDAVAQSFLDGGLGAEDIAKLCREAPDRPLVRLFTP